jgi:hypothetical protein
MSDKIVVQQIPSSADFLFISTGSGRGMLFAKDKKVYHISQEGTDEE